MHTQRRWKFLESGLEIPNLDDFTQTYLKRWILLRTPWFGIFLHKMTGPDSRETLHDHPWNFISLVLRGGYVERRLDPVTLEINEARIVSRWNKVRAYEAHSIRSLLREPTWTLVFVGRRIRNWGYLEQFSEPLSMLTPLSSLWRWTPWDQHIHHFEMQEMLRLRGQSQIHSEES